MDLTIIIVNWNIREMLKNCLESIMGNKGIQKIEIIVVDNASKDGSLKPLIKAGMSQTRPELVSWSGERSLSKLDASMSAFLSTGRIMIYVAEYGTLGGNCII